MGSNSRVLITIKGDSVAPRFDLCSEVLIADVESGRASGEPRNMILSGASADDICALAVKENVSVVICGGIEDSHYQYLKWKRIDVIDRVIGNAAGALALAASGSLEGGAVIRQGRE